MKQNLLIALGVAVVFFFLWKMMQAGKAQTEMLKSQTDILMAVALKTGAVQAPVARENVASERKETASDKSKDAVKVNKNVILTALQKRVIKLFDDETPKTSAQLRAAYNKEHTPALDAKKINNLMWNMKNNKGNVNLETFDDADSAWGLSEWFDGEKLSDEYFNRLKNQSKA